MSVEQPNFSKETLDEIVAAMLGETPHQMVARRLRENGVFSYLKDYDQPLPRLPETSGLKVVNAGPMFDFGDEGGGMTDSFIVYDPSRVEIRINSQEEKNNEIRRGRQSRSEQEARRQIVNKPDGWITPFPESRGRVVSYRPIPQPVGDNRTFRE